jgi:hypothetical protein
MLKLLYACLFLAVVSFTVTDKPLFADRSKKQIPATNQSWGEMIPKRIGPFVCKPEDFDGDAKEDGFADYVNAAGVHIELDFVRLKDAKMLNDEVLDNANLDDCDEPLKSSADLSTAHKYSYAVCADGEAVFAWNRGLYVFIVRSIDKKGEQAVADFMRYFPY